MAFRFDAHTGFSSIFSAARVNADAYWTDKDAARVFAATYGLYRRMPHLSSVERASVWQRLLLFGLLAVVLGGLSFDPDGTGVIFAVIAALAFSLIVVLRLAGLWRLAVPRPFLRQAPLPPVGELPGYAILVPLRNEWEVIPGLVAALRALDYPSDRLDIIFVTEADDAGTRTALGAAELAAHMRVVTVPAGRPRTKPRALNYALQDARGDLVAVYDAEDVPDRDQLLKAAAAFADADHRLACVQARLDVYNPTQSTTTRQFALEYAALFHGVLPALDRLRLPLPLGGTSNHFRRSVLEDCGAWDAFNVTEDADLGIRFVRLGYRVAMLDSSTGEEAPALPRAWLNQRTRWLKGWMQTYLVHMRSPVRLVRELGPWGFFGFQAMLGGMILSALVHPWFVVWATWTIAVGGAALPDAGALLWLCGFNLVAGYATGVALAVAAAAKIGAWRLVTSAVLIPFYWLAISFAAYCAVFDLIRRPHYWAKTPHGACNKQALRGIICPSQDGPKPVHHERGLMP